MKLGFGIGTEGARRATGRWAARSATLALVGCGPSMVDVLSKEVGELRRENAEIKKQLAQIHATQDTLETELFMQKDRLETAERNRMRRVRSPDELPEVRVKPATGPEVAFDPGDDRPLPVARRTDPGKDPDCALMDALTPDGRRIPGCGKDPAGPANEPNAEPPPKAVEPVRKKPSRSDKDAKAAYEDAMADLKAGRYNQAVDKFQSFVQTWPQHEYADNSLYWAGEAYYTRSLWNKALDLFLQVVEVYPMENKTADAMLKIGLCQMNLGEPGKARSAFESVILSYPDSPVANLAKQKLESL